MNIFKNSFFLSAISEWNKLDFNIRNSVSLNTFKIKLLNFIFIIFIILLESSS